MTDNALNTIKFIEEEYDINSIIANKVRILSPQQTQDEVSELIEEMSQEIANTLDVSMNEAILLYDEYTNMVLQVSTMLMLSEDNNG